MYSLHEALLVRGIVWLIAKAINARGKYQSIDAYNFLDRWCYNVRL